MALLSVPMLRKGGLMLVQATPPRFVWRRTSLVTSFERNVIILASPDSKDTGPAPERRDGAGRSTPVVPDVILAKPSTSERPVSGLWDIPISNTAIVVCWVQVLCFQLPLAYGGVNIFAELQGLSAVDLNIDDVASAALASDLLQLAGVAYLVNSAIDRGAKKRDERKRLWKMLDCQWEWSVFPQAARATISALALIALSSWLSSIVGLSDVEDADSTKILSALLGSDPSAPDSPVGMLPSSNAGTSSVLLKLAASNVLLGPLTEELFFRGFLLPAFCQWLGPIQAVAMNAALFAAFHFSSHDYVPLFLLGAVLSSSLITGRGNLAVPILAHAMYNATTIALVKGELM